MPVLFYGLYYIHIMAAWICESVRGLRHLPCKQHTEAPQTHISPSSYELYLSDVILEPNGSQRWAHLRTISSTHPCWLIFCCRVCAHANIDKGYAEAKRMYFTPVVSQSKRWRTLGMQLSTRHRGIVSTNCNNFEFVFTSTRQFTTKPFIMNCNLFSMHFGFDSLKLPCDGR